MWVAKFRLFSEESIYGQRVKKFNVDIYGYTLSHYPFKNKMRFISSGFLQGNPANKKAFLKDIRRDKRVIKLEKRDDFIVILTEEKIERDLKPFYDPAIIKIKPVLIDNKGFEHWEVASWERSSIEKLIVVAKKRKYFELLSIKKQKLSNIYVSNIYPTLSKGQKQAMETAIKNNYYDFPRETDLRKLAKLSGVSLSTFREHLRKAEKKIMPFLMR